MVRATGYLNLRILLFRAFLNLVVQKREKKMEISNMSIAAASKCVEMSMSLVQVTISSINPGSSGTLQAALFHAIGYLWNATLTLLLYVRSDSAQEILASCTPERSKVTEAIEAAAEFFATYRLALPFAGMATEKVQRLLRKIKAGHASSNTLSTSTDVHAGFTVPNLESLDRILNFIPTFDIPTFDAPRFNIDVSFPETPAQDGVTGLAPEGEQRIGSHWTPEGDGIYFYPTSDVG
jgi:hypothetical protein